VLLLDEPTNDLDIETLNVLEDFLDGWPGTLIVVSHDRYFLERVTDSVWALLGDGQVSMLPGGVDEYLRRRTDSLASSDSAVADGPIGTAVTREADRSPGQPHQSHEPQSVGSPKAKPGSAEERAAKKTISRVEKQLERIAEREGELNAQIAENAADYTKLAELSRELNGLASEKDELESEWLEASEMLG
jgi:ATP-binding cassette subfamily F protein uup